MNWIALALLAAACWGVEALLVDRAGLQLNPILGTGVGCIAAGGVFLMYIFATGNQRALASARPLPLLLFAVAGVLAFTIWHATYYMAIRAGHISRVAPLVSSYPLIAVLLSSAVLRESVSLQSALGALLIFGGAVMITI